MTAETTGYIGWALVMFGAFVLTEGYYAFRQRAERAERPGRYWWIAGLIWAVGLSLIIFGLELHGSAGG
jgi:hypothetical protein